MGGAARKRGGTKAAAAVVAGVREHVRSGSGVTNTLVNRFCREICSSDFQGVFSADCIPLRLAARPRFIIVVNLGKRKGVEGELPVGHFVTIAASPSTVTYIDPFGFPCVQRDINTFLHLCGRRVYTNLRQIQHFNSVYCGFFAILFASYLDRRHHAKKKIFQLRFKDTNLYQNDKLCMKYLQRIKVKEINP